MRDEPEVFGGGISEKKRRYGNGNGRKRKGHKACSRLVRRRGRFRRRRGRCRGQEWRGGTGSSASGWGEGGDEVSIAGVGNTGRSGPVGVGGGGANLVRGKHRPGVGWGGEGGGGLGVPRLEHAGGSSVLGRGVPGLKQARLVGGEGGRGTGSMLMQGGSVGSAIVIGREVASVGEGVHGTGFRDKGRTRIAKSRIVWCSANVGEKKPDVVVKKKSVSVILLAGGKGKRMGASMPKQYLPLLGQPIALYSFYTFSELVEVKEIVVVCDPSYQDIFEDTKEKINVELKFSLPGKERQDSVYSGLQAVDLSSELVCIHDSARPLVTAGEVGQVLKDGWLHGAAVLGVPVKATIKEANSESFVVKTLDRKTLWEMQTPQVIKPELLKRGFEFVNRSPTYTESCVRLLARGQSLFSHFYHTIPAEGLEVTDDVSIVEHLGHPVFITEGAYTNIKVTTPDDLLLAERILSLNNVKLPK
ncbi:hypothetical protein TIFTF001_004058 [Ficus carica]|uniref:2-C-methyl-D-erythritol 4-phosphate cytidylyltransferase, chloroplastic n=2 Tax=Magnoliopsida TaxID=3398 RepID=A0AA87ZEI8_FICCA|nr:hypothetical protein TIFTF001_004058 [Ficus carica]